MHPCKTPHAGVNAVLRELLPGLHAILGDQFVGMYLTGSLAAGDFDRNSDVDFAVVTEDEVGGELFSALDALHRRVATIDSWCATQLDGGYTSRRALRRFDPANAVHAHIDRGRGEYLKMVRYDVSAADEHLQMRPQGNRANVLGSELTAHSLRTRRWQTSRLKFARMGRTECTAT